MDYHRDFCGLMSGSQFWPMDILIAFPGSSFSANNVLRCRPIGHRDVGRRIGNSPEELPSSFGCVRQFSDPLSNRCGCRHSDSHHGVNGALHLRLCGCELRADIPFLRSAQGPPCFAGDNLTESDLNFVGKDAGSFHETIAD